MNTLADLRARPHWSYSSLNQLLNICSLQWYFEKIERLTRPFTPVSLAFGSAYHRVMEWIALNRMDGKTITTPDTRDLFNELWKRQVTDEEKIEFGEKLDADSCAKQGMDMCAAYLEQLDPEERVLVVGQVFAAPVGDGDKPLVGELDCIVCSSGDKVVVDWKTSARRWPKDQADKSGQATCYLYAHRQLHPGEEPGFRFDVAVKNKTPVVEQHPTTRTEDDFLRLEALVEKAEEIVAHELFYPADASYFCSGCPFAEPCKKSWHKKRSPVISTAALTWRATP